VIEFEGKNRNLEDVVGKKIDNADVAALAIAATLVSPYLAVAALFFLYAGADKGKEYYSPKVNSPRYAVIETKFYHVKF
jgi:hypothetical protein